jgi:hypothetical protein
VPLSYGRHEPIVLFAINLRDVGVAEVDFRIGCDAKFGVVSKLSSSVPGKCRRRGAGAMPPVL